MKPPYGNKPGGAGRPPSDRGPHQGSGGPSHRSTGSGAGNQRRDQASRPAAGAASQAERAPQGPRSFSGPRPDRAGSGPRPDKSGFGPRPDKAGSGPRPDKAGLGFRSGAPRPQAAAHGHGQTLRAPAGAAQSERAPQGPRPVSSPRPEKSGQAYRPSAPRSLPTSQQQGPDAPKGTIWLYGHHAVAAALANPSRRLRRLLLTEEAEATLLQRLKLPWPVSPERVDRPRMDQLLGRDIVHQGVALLADPLAPPSLQSVLERPGPLVVLDQVTDPRNVGAILRTAAAFGVAAVITQDRNSPEENGALAKAASGALETMPLLRAVNIARTLIALKAANIWCVGLDAHGPAVLSGPSLGDRRIALVVGAEGEGLRRLTKETCDEIAGLTIKGAIESLNVSAAAAVALYEITRRS